MSSIDTEQGQWKLILKPKTWQEHHTEMQQADRQEWQQVIAISFSVIAAGALLAYLIA